ncbi:MAG: diphthamide biosynthesis enzyme Dph2 [Methanobacteriaceae archaeon]|nr:diphthamide biosynthesis enzyme Dph2 [Methanobacteriaceae archaeon]
MVNYQLKEDQIVTKIVELNARVVGLQFPDGLRVHATKLARKIEKETGATTIISGDACYGACDLSDRTMEGCVDILIHFGHTTLPLDYRVPVLFVEAYYTMEVMNSVKEALKILKDYKTIGLVTTTQHLNLLDDVAQLLEKNGKKVQMGPGKGTLRGQVLGCNFSSARELSVDAFLYLGSGNFHPLGLKLSTSKPVIIADPYMNEARTIDEFADRILRARFAKITRAMDAKKWGILVSSKEGQNRLEMARILKEKIEDHGHEAYLILLENIRPELLMAFRDIDVFLVTACPRIAIDDAQIYEKPLITPHEMEIVLGLRDWEDYQIDEIIYE